MNRLALLAAFALCLPLTARADDASLHAKAQELVTLLHTDRMVTQISDSFRKGTDDRAQQTVGQNPTPDAKAKLDDFEKKVSDTIDSEIGWKLLEPQFVDIYASTFTEDELTGILAFYKSAAGIAFLEKTPNVNSQVTKLTRMRAAALQAKLSAAFDEFHKSVAPAVAPPPAAPAPANPK